MIEFICPCCGHMADYSEAAATKIFETVCKHMEVSTTGALTDRYGKKAGLARCVTIFFIKSMLNPNFKIISDFLKYYNVSTVCSKYSYVSLLLRTDKAFRRLFFQINEAIIDRLAIKKTLAAL